MKTNYKMSISTLRSLVWLALPIVMIFSGCENEPTEVEDYVPEPMLSAYLYNGEPVEEVFFEMTAPFGIYYDPADHAITDAIIVIEPLDDPSADPLQLTHDAANPGHYFSEDPNWLPKGKHSYRIVAESAAEGVSVSAVTMVPDTFSVTLYHPVFQGSFPILPDPPDSLIIADSLTRDDPEIFITWLESDSTGGYFCNMLALTDTADLYPLDPDWDPAEDELEEEDLWRMSIDFMLDNQFQYTMGWFNFNWVGLYRVDIMAVSEDYFDYVFSGVHIMQGLNVDLPSNIEGGQGIFGGMCRRSFYLNMKRVD